MKLVEKIISRVKGREFEFDPNVNNGYLIYLILNKLKSFIRGCVFLRRFIFLDRGSKVVSSENLHIKNLNIDIGKYCYINCLSKNGIELGCNFKLGDFSKIIASGTIRDLGIGIKIGNNVAIGEYSYIGGAGGVSIGSDCIIGQYFSVHPENHNFSEVNTLIRAQGVNRTGIKIGRNCWIGAKVTICDGANIGDNCVVAAGAVVTGSFGSGKLIGGVPAKVIKNIYE